MSKLSFMTEMTQEVVFTSEEPSLVMTYDRQLSVHSLWNLRATKPKACCVNCIHYRDQLVSERQNLMFVNSQRYQKFIVVEYFVSGIVN